MENLTLVCIEDLWLYFAHIRSQIVREVIFLEQGAQTSLQEVSNIIKPALILNKH
jgi:NhaP-type Na+/H+ and K+/H+ antiporter